MDSDAVKAYVRRDWAAIERLDRDYWAETFRNCGPDAGFRASTALAEHVRRVRPDWPSDVQKRDDLDHHVSLKRRIDRAAGAFLSR